MEVNGTAGADLYDQQKLAISDWIDYYALAGDDVVRMYRGSVNPGAGNDTVEKLAGANWEKLAVRYWDAPAGVVVDLAAGTAQDGYGGTDKLINVDDVHSGGNNDRLYGSAADNLFSPGGGQDVVDGRGGQDTVILPWVNGHVPTLADLRIEVSLDGTRATITAPLDAGFRLDLSNIERIALDWDQPRQLLTDFITAQQVAQQAIVAGDSLRWNAGAALGAAVNVSYSFVGTAPASGVGASGFRAFTAAEQQVVRKMLADTSAICGISFTEVSDSSASHGQIRFGVSQQASTEGVAWLPNQSGAGDQAGDVWMDVESMANLVAGSEGYAALLHELGHVLGLRHPTNSDAGDAWTNVVMAAYNNKQWSVMASQAAGDGLFRSDWGLYDVLALRYLYGSTAHAAGDDHYQFAAVSNGATTLTDDGGTDSIDGSAATLGVQISLLPGALSSIGMTPAGVAAVNNVAIASDSWIEQAIGTRYDDVLTGNERDNLLQGNGGNDVIDGGKGQDTVVFSGRMVDYKISSSYGTVQVEARDGQSGFASLSNVEILAFGDGSRMLLGDSAANVLAGSAGNDFLQGGAGNDTLDGGAGLDVASFSGARSQYSISKTADGFASAIAAAPKAWTSCSISSGCSLAIWP
jgi:Ca2+-binding RTX toxin-like protein